MRAILMPSKLSRAGLAPRLERFHLLQHHPIFCGLISFHINLKAQEAGLCVANAFGSILYTAHLYSAAMQEGQITHDWPDLDFALESQGLSRTFVGEPPNNFQDYLKRFLLCMGYSAQMFVSDRKGRNAKLKASNSGPRCLNLRPTPVCEIFRPRYCYNAASIELTEPSVQVIMDKVPDSFLDYIEAENGGIFTRTESSARSEASRKVQLNNLQLLDCLYMALSCEVDTLKFDFLLLHRQCWTMLKAVQRICHPTLVKYFEPTYIETESQLPFVVGYIFGMAAGSQKAMGTMFRPKHKPESTSKLFAQAATAMQSMLSEKRFSQMCLTALRDDADRLLKI